jgi:hypothetical protein
MFIDGVTKPHYDEFLPFQVAIGNEHSQWPPLTNAITYKLRSIDDGVIHEALTLAVTTRAMRGNIQADKDLERQEEYPSDEGPNLSDLDKVARKTAKEL